MPKADNPLRLLNAAGQSVWLDYIHRTMLDGELERLIEEDDLRGITSNPTLFEKAITDGHAYDEALRRELRADPRLTSRELFYQLAIQDIRAAADQFMGVYQASHGIDGRVSLEVSPDLAHDGEATVREALALNHRLQRPNAMIKVPATLAGLEAIEQLIFQGVNVNVTLLFSQSRYRAVIEAYLTGLERRLAKGWGVDTIASVASFFVSRVDSAIDPLLAERRPELQGKIAIANAKQAYQTFLEVFHGERFAELRIAGARPQRLLWASTGAKNPAYSDLIYVDNLIGPETVNTLPPATFEAFRDRGRVTDTLTDGVDEAARQLAALTELDIDLEAICSTLENDGVAAFAQSFEHLLSAIQTKSAQLAV